MHTTNYTIQKKNASRRATPSLSIIHNYVSAFTTNKPDSTPCTVIYSLGVVAVFRHAQAFAAISAADLPDSPSQEPT